MVMLKEEITVISLENVEVQHLEIRCVSRGERGGGGGGGPVLKFKKKCPDFGEKCPNFVHLWVEFLI